MLRSMAGGCSVCDSQHGMEIALRVATRFSAHPPQAPAWLQRRRLSGRVRTAGGTFRLVGVYETRGDSHSLRIVGP